MRIFSALLLLWAGCGGVEHADDAPDAGDADSDADGDCDSVSCSVFCADASFDRGFCVDGECRCINDPDPDAGDPDAGADSDSDTDSDTDTDTDTGTGTEPPSCDEVYGGTGGYTYCSETDDSCTFAADLGGGTCGDVCEAYGGSCLGAHSNGASPCDDFGERTCDYTCGACNVTCICSR